MLDITPSPWEVEKDDTLYGRYTIIKASKEAADWVDVGYDISIEEGDRRFKTAQNRDENNRRLIQAAPKLYQAALEILRAWGKYKNFESEMSQAIKNLAQAACIEGGE